MIVETIYGVLDIQPQIGWVTAAINAAASLGSALLGNHAAKKNRQAEMKMAQDDRNFQISENERLAINGNNNRLAGAGVQPIQNSQNSQNSIAQMLGMMGGLMGNQGGGFNTGNVNNNGDQAHYLSNSVYQQPNGVAVHEGVVSPEYKSYADVLQRSQDMRQMREQSDPYAVPNQGGMGMMFGYGRKQPKVSGGNGFGYRQ